MLKVSVENIFPITEARFKIAQLAKKVREEKDFLVLTKLGRPFAALVDIDLLGELIRYQRIGSLLEEGRQTFVDYLKKKGFSEEKIASLTEREVEEIFFGKKK